VTGLTAPPRIRTGGLAVLPQPRGTLSAFLIDALRSEPGAASIAWPTVEDGPLGEDLQLSLHVCYELHYQGFRQVSPDWEWDPELLRLRGELERSFLEGMRARVRGGDDADSELNALLVEPADDTGISRWLAEQGTWWEMREYFVHRSIYHHKEADPYAWVIPRLHGRAKAALVAVEYDEFGAGREERVHSRLFVDLLEGAGLEEGYLHYLDQVPAPMLAIVNMMSLFGLHRRLRGALVGHFAAAETASAPGARLMVRALERMSAPQPCVFFYGEHVEADAVHEQMMRRDVVGGLLENQPALAADVVLGIQATELLEGRLTEHLRLAWDAGSTSLRQPTSE
jgi:hypothetical protein